MSTETPKPCAVCGGENSQYCSGPCHGTGVEPAQPTSDTNCPACGHPRELHYSDKTGYGCTYPGCTRPDCFSFSATTPRSDVPKNPATNLDPAVRKMVNEKFDELLYKSEPAQLTKTKGRTSYAMTGKIVSVKKGRPSTADHSDEAEPAHDHSPVPPDGCTCASFWTIRGKHKADCSLSPTPAPETDDELDWEEIYDDFERMDSQDFIAYVKALITRQSHLYALAELEALKTDLPPNTNYHDKMSGSDEVKELHINIRGVRQLIDRRIAAIKREAENGE